MVKLQSYAIDQAMELQPPPETGKPYSVALPGSEKPGRTAVYRHWRFTDKLMESLDPNV
jgi:long-chain acyl-CoA synthetase